MRRIIAGILAVSLVGTVLGADLNDKYKGKKLDMKDLTGQVLENYDFEGSSLFLVKMKECKLAGSSFKDAELESASFDRADMTGCDFSGAHIKYNGFQSTILAKANLEGHDFTNVAAFLETDFRGANLKNTKNYRDINRADFRGASLHGAILLNVKNAETAKFKGAKYDAKTRFPEGIDPKEVGAVLEESDKDKK